MIPNLLRLYMLDGKCPVPVPRNDVLKWGVWFGTADRRVAQTDIGEYTISTIFLGVNHQYSEGGPPILFETMIFKGTVNVQLGDRPARELPNTIDYQERCSTWAEAEKMHARAVNHVRELTTTTTTEAKQEGGL